MAMYKRAVITGLGPVSALGCDRDSFWHYLYKGLSGIKVIESLKKSPYQYRCHIGGEVNNFSYRPYLADKSAQRFSRFTLMSLVAAHLALADAHLTITQDNRRRVGISLGTGIGGLDAIENHYKLLLEKSSSKGKSYTANAAIPNAATGEVSTHFGIAGPNTTISTGCSASANALGVALDWIRYGRADVVLSGGAETPFTDVAFSTFDLSKQLTTKNSSPEEAVTPFALNRDGFVLSEGAAILVIEELEHALKRGAHIYAEIVGYGSAADAYDSYKMEKSGLGLAGSMEEALRDADLLPYDIDYICAHGSGSPSADLKETNAIKLLFEGRAKDIPISTIKEQMGMPFGASTGFQMIATSLMMQHQLVVPTMNITEPDPACDLDYVPDQAREIILNYALLNSMGMGGNNATLAMKRFRR